MNTENFESHIQPEREQAPLSKADTLLIASFGDDPRDQAELFRAVSFRGRNVVGPQLSVELAAQMISDGSPRIRPYFVQLVQWLAESGEGGLTEKSFTGEDLRAAGLPVKDADQFRGYFRQLGALERTGSKRAARWELTPRGVEIAQVLGLLQ
ncbi:MAG: hypothetical protein KDD64_08040 [Bdellovibrionales bacterium]|nr:hypothetical protein [Bdellovibrionales bacterium]